MSTEAPNLRERLQSALGGGYTVHRELGGGGMSRIFLAHDTRLGRDVVVKVLSPELSEGLSAERFERELRIAARLQHPNIVPLLVAGSTDGLPYYTMPFVRGESLRARLTAADLTMRSAMRLLRDVAQALAFAHAEGVIHRDIKPENVLVADGIAVVTDFGIGKAIDAARSTQPGDGLTQVGVALGTPAYMAPEQAAGDPATDVRADLYAWAVVAYECLAGVHPFAGKRTSQGYITAHMIERPVPLTERSTTVPRAVASLVMQCLEKERERRPQSARAVIEVLESALESDEPASDGPSIAVLPFVNLSADPENEYFSDGITEEIRNLLAQDRTLRVAARSSSFAFKGRTISPREIAEQLQVRTLVEGSVRRAGNRVRITAQLVNAADGFQLWSDRFDRELTDIFAVQDEIADAIATTLRTTLRGPTVAARGEGRETGRKTRQPANVEAYDEYLKGRYLNHRRGQGHQEALTHFQRSLALDPTFAPALAGIAEAHSWLAISMVLPPTAAFSRTRRFAQDALAIDPNFADAHYLLGEIAYWHDWDAEMCERHVQRALALEPRSAEALQLSARLQIIRGRSAEGMADSDAAVRADPLSLGTRWYAVAIAYCAGWFDRVVMDATRMIEDYPGYGEPHRWRGKARCVSGDIEGGLADLQRAAELGDELQWLRAETASALCMLGRFDEARRIRDELVDRSNRGWIPPSAIALAEQSLGDFDAAFRWCERAFETRDFLCVALQMEHQFLRVVPPGHSGPITGDPRWADFVRRVGIADQ